MDEGLCCVATVQLGTELDEGLARSGAGRWPERSALRAVHLAGLNAEPTEFDDGIDVRRFDAFSSRMPSMGLAPRTFSTAASTGLTGAASSSVVGMSS